MTVGKDTPPGFEHRLVPDGCISIVCGTSRGASRASLLGPRAEPLTVPVFPGDRYCGARFWPDTGGAVLGLPARDITGRIVVPLSTPEWAARYAAAVSDAGDDAAVSRISDEMLMEPVAAAPAIDQPVRAAVVALIASRGEMTIKEVSAGVNLSTRQLERRFGDAVGLSPKQFARIRRVRSALTHLLGDSPRTWSQVAAEFGYADHAHLVRDTVALAGMTPTELAKRVRGISHGSVRP